MEIGGLIIAAVFVALVATVPSLVARRTAIVQSREIDRFSPKMRIIYANEPELDTCDHAGGTLLARRVLTSGESMQQGTPARLRPVIDRRNNRAVRDIAKLRARRAARIANEVAAGRRRMIVTGVCALSVLLVGVVIAATSLPWAWIGVPTAMLLASLVASRLAAIRSQRASQRERELLAKLRADLRRNGSNDGSPKTQAPRATVQRDGAATERRPAASTAQPVTRLRAVPAPSVDFTVDAPDALEVPPVPSSAWTVAPVPAPTYASRERIRGRIVHADTDLRGIPRVAATVPARPIAQTAQVGARTTDEVVADQIVALDLDAVLDARRAQ